MKNRDSFRHKGLRSRLVEEVRAKGINDEEVLKAMGNVPRHLFMDSAFVKFAYRDTAFPIGEGQTISQPYTVAFQTQLLEVETGHKILEVGTGSGYQAAILAEMGVEILTIERQAALHHKTSKLLLSLGYNKVKLILGDGYEGYPTYAPFDGIIITAGAPEVPQDLLLQLKEGGVMVAPIGKDVQTMMRIKRLSGEEFEQESFGRFQFVPMLSGVVKK